MWVCAAGEEEFGVLDVAIAGEAMERGDAEPIGQGGGHAVGEECFGDFAGFAFEGNFGSKIRRVAEQEADHGGVAFLGGALEGAAVVGKGRLRVQDGGDSLEVVVVGHDFEVATRAVRAEELDHAGVVVAEGGAQNVGGAFDTGVGIGAVLEEKFGDFVVAVVNGGHEGMAFGGDLGLGEIGVRALIEEVTNEFEMAAHAGVLDGCATAGVVGEVAVAAV